MQENLPKNLLSAGALTEPPAQGERAFANANDDSPPGGSPPLDAGPPRQPVSSAPASSSRQESPIERPQRVAREESPGGEKFDELREIWNRGHARDNAPEVVAATRQAFVQALKEGADPAEILAGAATWFAAFEAGDGPRYLPQLAAWLASCGWQKQPPMKPARRTHGNGNGRHTGNGHRGPPAANAFFQIAGYQQDENGNWTGGEQ